MRVVQRPLSVLAAAGGRTCHDAAVPELGPVQVHVFLNAAVVVTSIHVDEVHRAVANTGNGFGRQHAHVLQLHAAILELRQDCGGLPVKCIGGVPRYGDLQQRTLAISLSRGPNFASCAMMSTRGTYL